CTSMIGNSRWARSISGVCGMEKITWGNYIPVIMAQGFSIFETAIGPCGIVWNDYGIVGVQLPEATVGRTRSRLQKRFREARETSTSPEIAAAIDKIAALLNGEDADFSDTKLDIEALP